MYFKHLKFHLLSSHLSASAAIRIAITIACMTGALWAKRGERDISRGARHEREARDEGKRKIKRLFAVHCSCCSAHLRPQILTARGDVKRTNQNTIHYRAKIVTFLARSVCIAVEMRSYDCFHGFANSRLPKFMGLNHLILYVGQC